MRKINEIIIHCTATPADREVTSSELRTWHLARGFKDIGYHHLIHLNGRIEDCRPLDQVGAHCVGHNRTSIGICYVGGLTRSGVPADTRTAAQCTALTSLILWYVSTLPITIISGHRDYSSKPCPCFDAKREYFTFVE